MKLFLKHIDLIYKYRVRHKQCHYVNIKYVSLLYGQYTTIQIQLIVYCFIINFLIFSYYYIEAFHYYST